MAPDLDSALWLIDWLTAAGHTIVGVERQSSGEYLVSWH
jgi:hypothetical protein